MLQEDWEIDIKLKPRESDNSNKLMEKRVEHGLPAFEPKPEGVDAIGYGMFYDSIFELADAMVGRGEEGGHVQLKHYFSLVIFITIAELSCSRCFSSYSSSQPLHRLAQAFHDCPVVTAAL